MRLLIVAGVGTFIAQASTPTDPVLFFIGQGVLGVVCFIFYKDNKELRKQNSDLYEKVMNEHIPLLTRATISIERAAQLLNGHDK